MSMPSVLLIGLSHVVSIRNAQTMRLARNAATFNLVDIELFPKYNPLVGHAGGQLSLHPDVEPDLRRAVEAVEPQLVIGSFWSNQHFFMSTANLPRRLDFVLPSAPDLPLDPTAELVPYDVIHHNIQRHCLPQELLTDVVQRLTRTPLYVLPAPPPIEDFSAIPNGSSSKEIDALVAQHGAAPACLRYKFWRLVETIHKEMAAARNVKVLPIPPGTADAAGFRRPEYHYSDWIHANTLYGELVLKQFDALTAQT